MADQYKTRCPHCSAQFKITDAHLKQARGAVRCGSCLQIFQADEHLLDTDTPATHSAADAEDTEAQWSFSEQETQSLAEDDPLASWSLDSNTDTDKPASPASPDQEQEQDLELSNAFLNMEDGDDVFSLDEDFSDMQGAGKASHSDDSDESWADALLAELEDDEPGKPDAPPAPQAPAAEPHSPAAPTSSAPATTLDTGKTTPSPAVSTPPAAAAKEPFNRDFDQDKDDGPLFAGLDLFADAPEPQTSPSLSRPIPGHHTAHPIPPRDYRPLLKWSSLSLLALLVLAAQYLLFNFNDLARMEQWRPYYAQACQWLGCELPSRSDTSKLRGANLVVRSHPQYQNALVVDAILFNEAHYRQPFPILELSFSTLNGQPVASRQFTPREYLKGDLASMETMPIGTPLHLSLEIVDPGEQAVNYNLRLLAGAE